VRDRLPEGVRFVRSEPGEPTCVDTEDLQNRDRVTCTFDTLAPGASQEIQLVVTAPNEAGVIENFATVESEQTEPETSNTVRTTVAPDLSIIKRDSPGTIEEGDLLLYTLTVRNGEASEARDVVVIDELPEGVVFVSADESQGDCDEQPGRIVECELGNLAPGATATVDILVRAEEAGTLTNTARVFAGDLERPIDRDREETTVEGDAETNEPPEETTTEETTTEETTTAEETTADGDTAAEANNLEDGEDDVLAGTVPDGTLPETGGPGGIALAAGCALLGVGLIVNRIAR